MIEAADVTVLYRRGIGRPPIRALDGFHVSVERGDVFGLLGPNGAGKSTAMYCFLGLIKPNRGSVHVFGESPQPGARVFERIAYVPEEPHYHLYLTVEEAVTYYAALYRTPVSPQTVEAAIRQVGLHEFRDLRLDKCSKGMKQKVGLATCLLNHPQLIFLDEPTRGLDPIMVKEFRDILLRMNEAGTTIVLNSHVLSEVEMVCNRVAIMDHGKVLVHSALRNLLTVDLENYEVTLAATTDVPPFLTVTGTSKTELRGLVPTGKVDELFRFAAARQLQVYSCALKKLSLEDAFVSVLGHRG